MKPAWLGTAVLPTVLVAALSGCSSSQPELDQSSVTDVLDKVTSGQAARGVVCHRCGRRGRQDDDGGVRRGGRVVNTYPIAVLTSAPEADVAQKFVDLVAGEAGQRVLTQAGFGTP